MSSPRYLAQKIRQVEAWGDGFPPSCACGCGEPVPFGYQGPRKYVNQGHVYWERGARGDFYAMGKLAGAATHRGNVEIEAFRKACRQIKRDRGWTWAQMAEVGGWHRGTLNTYMYDKRYSGIGQDMARGFLRRLAGMPEPMTKYQVRMAKARAEREQIALSQIRNSHHRPRKGNRSDAQ